MELRKSLFITPNSVTNNTASAYYGSTYATAICTASSHFLPNFITVGPREVSKSFDYAANFIRNAVKTTHKQSINDLLIALILRLD